MMLWSCNGYPQQTWGYDSDPSAYRIYVANTAVCFDWWEGDYDNGQDLHIWECNGHTNQQWGVWDSPAPSGGGGGGGGGGIPGVFMPSCSYVSGGNWPQFNSQS